MTNHLASVLPSELGDDMPNTDPTADELFAFLCDKSICLERVRRVWYCTVGEVIYDAKEPRAAVLKAWRDNQ